MKTMKTRLLALLGSVLLLMNAPVLSAQDYVATPVQVSSEKVRLNGKVYLSHPVLERQTLFGIAKAYGVTVDDLYAANPDLREKGLQSNTTILIPTEKEAPAAQPTTPSSSSGGYWEHTVKWFEGLSDIAASYGVTEEEIMQANGLTSRKVTKRQILRIPVKRSTAHAMATGGYTAAGNTAASTAPSPASSGTTVLPPEIPVLSDPEIKEAEFAAAESYKPVAVDKLRVEKAEKKEETVLPPEVPVLSDPEIADPDPVTPETGDFKPIKEETPDVEPANGIFDWFTRKGSVEMALILPFNAGGSYSETNMDFYSGVLMALRDLQGQGVKANLNVYDLQAGLPSAFDLSKNDFILGPVTTRDLTSLLEKVEGRVPVVSPLDQRAAELTESHNGLIQAPSAASSQYEDLAAWAAQEAGRTGKVILVTEKVSGSTAPAVGVRNALLDAGTSFEGVSYSQAEGRSLPAGLAARMSKGGVNHVIVASEKEAFISDAVRNLNILRGRGYDIVMYAPSKVRTFDTVDGTAYHQNNLHISSSYYVDYDDPKVKAFVRAYRALYRTEPSQFAFQGYDTARYFASLVAKYGNRWTSMLEKEESKGLHTDFRFVGTRGSFRNTAVRRIIYDRDYSTGLAR
jgi:LysM repeat protein/ABC-type branched-subunit amino acid transport system substrate-binding protein